MCAMKRSMRIDRITSVQFVKFCTVGALNTLIHYGVFYGLIHLVKWSYLIDSLIGYCAGLANSYAINRKWTFRELQGSDINKEFLRFATVNILALLVNLVSLKYLVQVHRLQPVVGQFICIPLSTIANFMGNKYWTFSTGKTSDPTSSKSVQASGGKSGDIFIED